MSRSLLAKTSRRSLAVKPLLAPYPNHPSGGWPLSILFGRLCLPRRDCFITRDGSMEDGEQGSSSRHALGRGRSGGLRRRSSIRQKVSQTILRKVGQPLQHVAQVDERVVSMRLVARHHAEKYGH